MSRLVGPVGLLGEVEQLWRDGLPRGDLTGWPSIDRHYSVAPGQLTIITGWPGSGKSEWLDALLVNLMHQGWRTAIFSPENQPLKIHVSKLLEKVIGKPFGPGPTPRMDLDEVRSHTIHMLAGVFTWIEPPEQQGITAAKVIELAEPWLETAGTKRGLVMDPWNELEHWRPSGLSETEYVSQQLSLVRNWARATGVHVWIVAHPQKMRRNDAGDLPVPKPDMISGSQHWWNKADCALTVWRDMGNPTGKEVDIHIQKVRFKHIGCAGVVRLHYDRTTGRYHEPPAQIDYVPKRGVGQ